MRHIPYGRQLIDKSDIAEVVSALQSDWMTQGPRVSAFEKALGRYCHVKYVVAVSSGTAALHLACLAAGLGKGDEAITTPITFLATPNAVLYTGAKPVFADIDVDTMNIDPVEINKKITPRTKAILPVHFSGMPCDMPEIYKIARKNNLKIIEDACHALGAEYQHGGQWIKAGSCRHSDMTVFSFHPVKHITTGEGGAVTTNSKNLYEQLCALRTHGMYRSEKMSRKNGRWYYEMRDLGFNYRITDFQCALGISQLKKIDGFIKKRRAIVKQYEKEFENNQFFDLPVSQEGFKSSWHLYPVKLKDRYAKYKKELVERLRKKGIFLQVHYIPVHLQPYYQRYLRYRCGDYPAAENYYKKALSLPLYPGMTQSDMKYVVKNMKDLTI